MKASVTLAAWLGLSLVALLASGHGEAAEIKVLRAAYLVGLNDDAKREQIYVLVKQLYGQRSSIVHGARPRRQDSNRLSPWKLRGLVRDLFVAFVALRQRVGGDDQWMELLRRVVVSRKDQVFVARVTQRPLRLVRSPQ